MYAHYGFSAPFLVAAGIQLLTLLLTIFGLPESTSQQERSDVATFRQIWASLTNRAVAPLLIQLWAFSLSLYAWFAVFTLLLKEGLGMTADGVSYLFAAFGVVSVILQVGVTGNVNDKLGARRSANIGIASLFLGFLLVPFEHTLPTILPTIFLFGFGMSIARPSLTALLTDQTPENQRGTILGVSSALDNLSGVLMPPLSTGLLGAFGPSWAGAVSAFWSFIALVLGLRAQRKEGPHIAAQAEPAAEKVS
jgi:predicted MFS family arabinose efflux permease